MDDTVNAPGRRYEHQLRGEHLTAACAERFEAARRAPRAGCPGCQPTEACSWHIAEQFMDAVRNEDLVLMELTEADAIIRASVARLTAAATRPAADAAEEAFELLLKIAAFGAHSSHRDDIRADTIQIRTRYRAAADRCAGCGHDPHDPEPGEIDRICTACTDRSCRARRGADDTIRYRR